MTRVILDAVFLDVGTYDTGTITFEGNMKIGVNYDGITSTGTSKTGKIIAGSFVNNGTIALVKSTDTQTSKTLIDELLANDPIAIKTSINDIIITNNGTISLTKKTATGIAVDYGLINNSSTGIISITGDDSAGILAANGSIVTNNGIINISGKESAGIYARNYFDGTAATSAAVLGYGDNSININNNGKLEILASSALNSEVYGIYLDNSGAVPANKSLLTLGTNSKIIVGNSNPASVNKNIGISLINSALLDNGGNITIGIHGIGIYAKDS